MDTSLVILPPPDPSGSQYSDMATLKPYSSAPVKEGMKVLFGHNVDTLQQAEQIADSMNINLQLGGSIQSAKVEMQQQLNTLDPSSPKVPILLKYVEVCEQLLQGGGIPGIEMSVTLKPDGTLSYLQIDADNVKDSEAVTTAKADVTPQVAFGNRWLVGNAAVAYRTEFIKLMRILMQNKAIKGKIENTSMALLKEMASVMKDLTIASGKIASEMARNQGISSIVSATTTGVCTVVAGAGMLGGAQKPEVDTYEPIPQGKAPDLNNYSKPVLHPDGTPVEAPVPTHIKYQTGVDGAGQPTWSNTMPNENNLHASANIRAVRPDGVDGMIPKTNPLTGSPRTFNKYEQYPMRTNPDTGELCRFKSKEDIVFQNKERNNRFLAAQALPKMVSESITQGTQAWEQLTKSALELEKAQKEADKEFLASIQRIVEKMMSGAGDELRKDSDQIDQLLSTLKNMCDKLSEAVSAAYRRR